MKLDENICILPHCEETIFLVEKGCPFCIEHRKRFDDFVSRCKIESETKNMLENDKELRNEFFTDIVDYFVDEEEQKYHRKNKQVLKKKKPKKKTKKKSKGRK